MTCISAQRSMVIAAAVAAFASGSVHAQRSPEEQRSEGKRATTTQREQPEKTGQEKRPERKETPPPKRKSKQADCKGPAQLCKQDSAR